MSSGFDQNDLEVCILAGGLSSRMGRNKAVLKLGGKSLLQHVRAAAETLHVPIHVQRHDLVKRCGPLGGIFTGLKQAKRSRVLFLPCDMPFITADWLKLIARSSNPAFSRTEHGAGFPFVLRTQDLPVLEEQIEHGEFSIQQLARRLRARLLSCENPAQFVNINTPEELESARQTWTSRPGANMTDAIIKVSGLSIYRDRTMILEDISWEVQRGQHWVILGANGSGKTSLLSSLTGYLTPTSGEIDLLGERFGRSDWRELRKSVGLVSSSIRQLMPEPEIALHTVASGKWAMIDLWHEPSRAEVKKAKGILRDIECSHLEQRPWLYLSQGERQRILIGRALMASPTLLVLDEPCAGLDPVARENFLHFLQRLCKSATAPTVVLVTHHVEEIMPAFSHVLLVKEGRVLSSGSIRKCLTSTLLSDTFAAPLRLQKQAGRYSLLVQSKRSVVI